MTTIFSTPEEATAARESRRIRLEPGPPSRSVTYLVPSPRDGGYVAAAEIWTADPHGGYRRRMELGPDGWEQVGPSWY